MIVKHSFVSEKPDSSDPSLVNPSNWNDEHVIETPASLIDEVGVLIGTDNNGIIDLEGVASTIPFSYLRQKGNVSEKGYEFAQFGHKTVSDYNFPSQVPGGNLTAGITNIVTLTPVPLGINGTNTNHRVLISNGVGAREAVLITGGTAISGSQSGTITFVPLYNHSGNWTISSATAGWQESAWYAGQNASIYFAPGTYNMYASFTVPYDNQVYYGSCYDEVTITQLNGVNLHVFAVVQTKLNITFTGLGFDGNFVNQTYTALTLNTCINGQNSIRLKVISCRFHAFGDVAQTSEAQVISLYSSRFTTMYDNLFVSNHAFEINMNGALNCSIIRNIFGSSHLSDSRTNVDWWDTYAGGFGTLSIGSSDINFSDNRMFGVARGSTTPLRFGYMISYGGGTSIQGINIKIHNNFFNGLGNAQGTVTVTNGSGVVTGLNTIFNAIDVNRAFMVDGDATLYKVTSYTSPTQITVSPIITRSSAGNLRYRYQNSGDAISVYNSSGLSIIGNTVLYSGDMGCDIASTGGLTCQHAICEGNIFSNSQVFGLYLGGALFDIRVSNNLFINNCKKLITDFNSAIYFSPTDLGSTTAQAQWHIIINDNNFIDDQVVATQKYAIGLDITLAANIVSNSHQGNHLYVYDGSGAFFHSNISKTIQGSVFNYTTFNSSMALTPVPFALLGQINIAQIPDGTIVYCFDAKNAVDNAVASGSVAVGGGSGAILFRQNGKWITH